ncbi:hypothetical protein ACVLD2_002136 [Paenibacillus sp. PvR052]
MRRIAPTVILEFTTDWRINNETVALMRLYNQKIRVQGLIDHPLNELLYSDLGLRLGSCVPLNQMSKEFELDSLPPFQTDHLFISPRQAKAGEDDEAYASLQQCAVWNATKAVWNKRTRLIPNWIGMSWSPVGRNQIMDELLEWQA